MTPRQIRVGFVALGVITGSVAFNLLAMQPGDGRATRPERAYRGLDTLPGTPSTSVKESAAAAAQAAREEGARFEAPALPASGRDTARTPALPPGSEMTRAIQKSLSTRGYASGESDGAIDVVTRAAILHFESDYGLPLTAEPSAIVLDALERLRQPVKVAASTTARPGPEVESLIRTVQQSLDRHGYRPGAADGRLGDATAQAIRAFERDHGLAESGRISAPLVARLADIAGTGRLAAARD